MFTTGALGTQQTAAAPEPKVDPVCVTLVSRIEGLRKQGVADKIEKAAKRKYRLTRKDLRKADELTKANAEFQLHCSTIMPKPATAQVSSTPVATASTATKQRPKAARKTTGTQN